MSDRLGEGGIYLPVIKELNLYISFLLTEPSGYGLYGLFKNFFFKMQFMPSRQQRAVADKNKDCNEQNNADRNRK